MFGKEFYVLLFSLQLILFAAMIAPAQHPERSEDGSAPGSSRDAIDEASFKLRRGEKEWTIVPSFAPTQPLFLSGGKEYDTAGRKFGMLNVQFARTIGTMGPVTYQYFFEFTPLAIAFNNEVRNPRFISESVTPIQPKTIRKTAYGAGFQPANFRFLFRPNKRIKPYAQVGVGMMFFNQKMPVPDATNYNFTGDFGGGLHIMTGTERDKRRAITLGYRYFHISNFNTSAFNPGYNASTFYIGYSFLQ